MSSAALARPLNCPLVPRQVLWAWPRARPLGALLSCPREGSGPWARWSILASPERVVAIGSGEPDPIGRLEAAIGATRMGAANGNAQAPFVGGWMVALGYELGRTIEPTAAVHAARTDPDWPWPIVLWRCPGAFAYDHEARQWWAVGDADGAELESNAQREPDEYELGMLERSGSREEYIAAARRAVEYIHAGDCFQVNVSHRIGAPFSGSARGLFARLLDDAGPWYGAYLELAAGSEMHSVLSVSPELLLGYDAQTRRVITRPIKGTRPGRANPDDLRASAKDQAELHMIIDLMRNDLGRVCRVGSVRVAEARAIERHGSGNAAEGVHHGVATIEGALRDNRSVGDLLRAIFPGGSITGAPKIRAMQIIEELEPVPRGLYTGAIGFISDCGNISLNIAIRTAIIRGRRAGPTNQIEHGTLTYGAGAGIVADSVPEQEWQETLDKAGVLLQVPRRLSSVSIDRTSTESTLAHAPVR